MSYPKQYFYANHGHIIKRSDVIREWFKMEGELPDNFMVEHHGLGPRYGCYFIPEGTDRTVLGLIDLDDHSGEAGWDKVREFADAVLLNLAVEGFTGVPFRSGSRSGINIWVLFDEPVQAAAVRKLLRGVLAQCGLRDNSAGIIANEAEVFPKQDSVAEGSWGSAAALPRFALDPITLEDMDFSAVVWQTHAKICDVELGENYELALKGEQLSDEQLKDLLAHIPNNLPRGEGTETGLNYDDWFRVVMAAKACGANIDMMREWSKQSSQYNAREFNFKWRSFKRVGGPNAVGAGTLRRFALELGDWSGAPVDIDAFPVMVDDVPLDYERVRTRGRYLGYVVTNVVQMIKCMRHDPKFPWVIAYDEFMQERMVLDKRNQAYERYSDHHAVHMRAWFDENRWEPVSTSLMREVAQTVAKGVYSNIARDWANGLVWDGVDRFPDLLMAARVQSNDYSISAVRYWLTAHAARALQPGYKADAIIVIVSPQQGIGKTSLIQRLAPTIKGISTYRDVDLERLLTEESAARSLRGCLVANMDELRNFGKRESAQIKSALSRTHESFVPKYMETREEFARCCVLYATSNETALFDDNTGNRRYLVLQPEGVIDLQWVEDNCEQLWAQGVALFKEAGLQWQDVAVLAVNEVERYESKDPWFEAIEDYLAKSITSNKIKTKDLLSLALQIPVERQNRRESNRCAAIMRKLGWELKTIRIDNKPQKIWVKEDLLW